MNQHWADFTQSSTGSKVVIDMKEIAMFVANGETMVVVTLRGGGTVILQTTMDDIDRAIVNAREQTRGGR